MADDIQIKVDASQAKRELASFAKAVESTGQAVQKLGQMSSTGGFAQLSRELGQVASGFQKLKSVTGIAALARDIYSLNVAFTSFKGPSAATAANINAFSKAVNSMGRMSMPRGIGAELQSIGAGLASIRVPNISNLRQIPVFITEMRKLGQLRIDPRVTADIAAMGQALGSFRVPSPQTAQNAVRFISALATGTRINPQAVQSISQMSTAFGAMRVPTASNVNNLARMINVLSSGNPAAVQQMARALSSLRLPFSFPRLNLNMNQLRGGGGGNPFASMTAGARGATGALRGLENQFSATYHISSLLRVAMGSLTLGAFASGVMTTGRSFQALQRGLESVAMSSTDTADHIKFIDDLTKRLPISLEAAADSYRQFGISAREAGTSNADTQRIFEGFSTAFAGIGLDAEKQRNAFLAVEQIMTKGKFAMQELQQQLGNNLPGVKAALAQSMGLSMRELEKQLEKGISADALIKMADTLKSKWGPAVASSLATGAAQAQRFENEWTRFKRTVFDNGFDTGMAGMFKQLTGAMEDPSIQNAAKRIGEAFGEVFRVVGAIGTVMLNNIEPIARFGTVLALVVAGGAAIGGLRMLGGQFLWLAMTIGGATLSMLTFAATTLAGGVLDVLALTSRSAAAVAVSFGAMGRMALVAGAMIKAGIWGMLYWMAYEAGQAIGNAVNDLFPNFAAKVQDWKDSLDDGWFKKFMGGHTKEEIEESRKNGAAAGKAQGQAQAQGWGDSFMKDIQQFDITASLEALLGKVSGMGGDNGGLIDQIRKQIEESKKLQEQIKATAAAQGDYAANTKTTMDAAIAKTREMTAAEDQLMKKIQPFRVALEDLKSTMRTINGMDHLTAGPNAMDPSKIQAIKDLYAKQNLEKVDPVAGHLKGMLDQMAVLKLEGDERARANEFLQVKNQLLREGIDLDLKENAETKKILQDMIAAKQIMEKGGSNGFQQWASGIKEFKVAVDDGVKKSLDDVSSSLADLVVTGKMDLAQLAQSILKTFAKVAVDGLMKDAMNGIFGKPDFSGLMGQAQGKVDAGLAKFTDTAQMNVNAANVIINANGLSPLGEGGTGATGITTGPGLPSAGAQVFGSPTTTDISGVNPTALGGTAAATTGGSLSDNPLAGVFAPLAGVAAALGAPVVAGTNAATKAIGGSVAPIISSSGFSPATVSGTSAASTIQSLGITPPMPMPRPGSLGSSAFGATAQGIVPAGAGFVPRPVPASAMSAVAASAGRGGMAGREEQAFNFLKSKGYSDRDASNIMGNLKAESKFDPNAFRRDDAGPGLHSYGIAQWNRQRATDMKAFTSQQNGGADYNSLNADQKYFGQLGFLDKEIQNNPRYKAALTRASSAGDNGGMTFGRTFEGYEANDKRDAERNLNASQYYRRFGGKQSADADLPSQKAHNASSDLMQPNTPEGFFKPGQYDPNDVTGSIRGMRRSPADDRGSGTTGSAWDNAYREPGTHEGIMDPSATPMFNKQGVGFGGTGSGWQNQLSAPGVDMGGGSSPQGAAFLQAAEAAPQKFTSAFADASKGTADMFQTNMSQVFSGGGAQVFQPISEGIKDVGAASSSATPQLGSFIDTLMKAAAGGGGGGAGGEGGGFLSSIFSGFKEGGYSTSPVTTSRMPLSAWHGAPHYAEGTPNTSGGIPAVLHDNEAVIPLSRGRHIPVEMKGGGDKNVDTGPGVVNNYHFHGVKDFDTFRRSKDQMAAAIATQQQRAAVNQG